MEKKILKLDQLVFFVNRNKPTHYYCLTLLGNTRKFMSPNNQSQRICFIYIFCPNFFDTKSGLTTSRGFFCGERICWQDLTKWRLGAKKSLNREISNDFKCWNSDEWSFKKFLSLKKFLLNVPNSKMGLKSFGQKSLER